MVEGSGDEVALGVEEKDEDAGVVEIFGRLTKCSFLTDRG